MELTQKEFPENPEYNNSAGRLIKLLEFAKIGNTGWRERACKIYGLDKNASNILKSRALHEVMRLIIVAIDEFFSDIQNSTNISLASQRVLNEGLIGLSDFFSIDGNSHPPQLSEAHKALLQLAGSMLEEEPIATQPERDQVRAAVEELWDCIKNEDLPKTVKVDLLEIVRLARNAVDQYSIHGVRGFRKALKRMIAEMMEIYAEEGCSVEDKSWWRAAKKVLCTTEMIAGKILQYKPLIEWAGAASGFLPPPSTN